MFASSSFLSCSVSSEWSLSVVAVRSRIKKVAGVVVAVLDISFANVVDTLDMCLSELLL